MKSALDISFGENKFIDDPKKNFGIIIYDRSEGISLPECFRKFMTTGKSVPVGQFVQEVTAAAKTLAAQQGFKTAPDAVAALLTKTLNEYFVPNQIGNVSYDGQLDAATRTWLSQSIDPNTK